MDSAPIKPQITLDDLQKIDIRIGTILSVTEIERSRDLVHLTVDFGSEHRNVIVGMKRERADVQEVVGRQALFVVNLAPRKMAGILSEAMLFDIGYADGLTPCPGTAGEARAQWRAGRLILFASTTLLVPTLKRENVTVRGDQQPCRRDLLRLGDPRAWWSRDRALPYG